MRRVVESDIGYSGRGTRGMHKRDVLQRDLAYAHARTDVRARRTDLEHSNICASERSPWCVKPSLSEAARLCLSLRGSLALKGQP